MSTLRITGFFLLLLLLAPRPARAQQDDPAKDTKKTGAELEESAKERLSQFREDLQALFDRRKSQVKWGQENRQTRVLGTGAGFGTATLRFEYLWAEGVSEKDGQKATVPYWKQAVAQFDYADQKWRLTDVTWRFRVSGAIEGRMDVLVDDGELLRIAVAEKGMSSLVKEAAGLATAGKWEEAIAALTKAVDLEPQAPIPRNQRGLAYFRTAQWDRALDDFSKAVELRPDNPVFRCNRADTYGKLGQWDKALDDLSKAIQLQPDRDLTWLLRGSARASLGQWDKAAEDFEKAATFPKTFHRAWSHLAVVRLQQKDAKGYREACNRLLDEWSDSADPQVTALVAWTCSVAPGNGADLGRLIQALEKKEVTDYTSLRALGAAQYRSGKSSQAVKVLAKAIESRSEPATMAWIFLAMAHHELGNKEEARQWLDKAKARWSKEAKDNPAGDGPGGLNKNRAPWNELLVVELTMREAEELLKNPGK
jgi:tetratricopeptide (TPR) repeat protein